MTDTPGQVRTTVRSSASTTGILRTHSLHSAQLEIVTVPNIESPGAFDEAVSGVHGVVHTSSPFPSYLPEGQTIEEYLLNPAVNGTTSLLNSLVACNPGCAKFVLTSSFASVVNPFLGPRPGYTYTEKDWNPIPKEVAINPDMPLALSYSASKTYAEQAAMDFPGWDQLSCRMISLCPVLVYGPLLPGFWDKGKGLNALNLNTSSIDVYRLMDGSADEVPGNDFWAFVDVRDVAAAHLAAYELDSDFGTMHTAGSEEDDMTAARFVLSGGSMTYQRICDILRDRLPDLRDRVPEGDVGYDQGDEAYKVDNSKASKVLGVNFKNLETCIVDMAEEFLRIENVAKE